MMKKTVFIFSSIGALITLLVTEEFRFCYLIGLKECLIPLSDSSESLLFPFLPLLFFSIITYKMHEEVFRLWWGFARWFAPVIVVATLLLNLSSGGGGLGIGGAVAGAFEFFLLFFLYAIFILVSIVKIVLAHIRLKRGA